jgi:hypothetical protein
VEGVVGWVWDGARMVVGDAEGCERGGDQTSWVWMRKLILVTKSRVFYCKVAPTMLNGFPCPNMKHTKPLCIS